MQIKNIKNTTLTNGGSDGYKGKWWEKIKTATSESKKGFDK